MAKKVALVLPTGVSLTVEPDGLCIETDVDIIIEGPPSQTLARLQSNKGNVSIKSSDPVAVGSVHAPEGTIQLSGKVQIEHAEGQVIDFSSGNLKATVLRASKSVNLAGTKLEADVVKAPRVDVTENLKGRATAIDCDNELNPHKLRGGFNLDEFVSLMPKGVDTLRTHGIAVPDEPGGYGSSDDDDASGDDDSEAEQPGSDDSIAPHADPEEADPDSAWAEEPAPEEPEEADADSAWAEEPAPEEPEEADADSAWTEEPAPEVDHVEVPLEPVEAEAPEAHGVLAADVEVPEAESIDEGGEAPLDPDDVPQAELPEAELPEAELSEQAQGFEGVDSLEGAAISSMVQVPEEAPPEEPTVSGTDTTEAHDDVVEPPSDIAALTSADTVLDKESLPLDALEAALLPDEADSALDDTGDVHLEDTADVHLEDTADVHLEDTADVHLEDTADLAQAVESAEDVQSSADESAQEGLAAEPDGEAHQLHADADADVEFAGDEAEADVEAEYSPDVDPGLAAEAAETTAEESEEEPLAPEDAALEASEDIAESPEMLELRADLEDALQRIVSSYADGALPPPIEQLAALTKQADLDELRSGFHGLWRDLVTHVRQTGSYHSNVVTRSFERIQQLLASS